jgi:hypothetical protein
MYLLLVFAGVPSMGSSVLGTSRKCWYSYAEGGNSKRHHGRQCTYKRLQEPGPERGYTNSERTDDE